MLQRCGLALQLLQAASELLAHGIKAAADMLACAGESGELEAPENPSRPQTELSWAACCPACFGHLCRRSDRLRWRRLDWAAVTPAAVAINQVCSLVPRNMAHAGPLSVGVVMKARS